jgi:hypothetical protein
MMRTLTTSTTPAVQSRNRRGRRHLVCAAVVTSAVLGVLGLGATSASAMTPAQTTESGVVNLLAGSSTGSR